MKIVETVELLSVGDIAGTPEWRAACRQVRVAVRATVWPPGSDKFTIYPESGKQRGKGNGVLPIKIPCVRKLAALGWKVGKEARIPGGILLTGDLDALREGEQGRIGFEWETGNISSSHRAVNKLLLASKLDEIVGGFLVVPSRQLARYLTDRIGNIEELRPYFRLWDDTKLDRGVLQFLVVEHDAERHRVRKIPKMTAGRALG
jgi:Restriction endonuclease BamHI